MGSAHHKKVETVWPKLEPTPKFYVTIIMHIVQKLRIVNGFCGIFTTMEEKPTHEKWGGNKLKPFYQTWLVKKMWRHPLSESWGHS